MMMRSSVARHTSHVTRHTSYVTRHTTYVTRHTSHVTRHTSHVVPPVTSARPPGTTEETLAPVLGNAMDACGRAGTSERPRMGRLLVDIIAEGAAEAAGSRMPS
jgi:hypothetical protein